MSNANLLGIDVSVWQDNNSTPQRMNFEKAKQAGACYVFIKASQGTRLDQDFLYNWQAAKDAGLPRGAYHYLDWRSGIMDQARFFAGVLANDPGEMYPVLDYEMRANAPAKAAAAQKARTFIELCQSALGEKLMLYTSPGYWADYGSEDSWWMNVPLWIANYNVPSPRIPFPWTSWMFWQYTDRGDGIAFGAESYRIDMNWFNGNEDKFEQLFGETVPQPPPPKPETPMISMQVLSDTLTIRTGPGTSYPPTGTLTKGDIITDGVAIVGSDAWLQHGRGYSAIDYKGTQYMEIVE